MVQVAKHTPELAQLVVGAGGVGALVDYVAATKGNTRLPGIMALGYIAAFSETLGLAVIAEKGLVSGFRIPCLWFVMRFGAPELQMVHISNLDVAALAEKSLTSPYSRFNTSYSVHCEGPFYPQTVLTAMGALTGAVSSSIVRGGRGPHEECDSLVTGPDWAPHP